ncbi:hypothetical protein [Saccharopolyspora taberi]|uniref:hypothetical protein n=1 Tax=Saccharopolyspora taberi TaxID=60895 RepID=UPI0031D8CE3C
MSRLSLAWVRAVSRPSSVRLNGVPAILGASAEGIRTVLGAGAEGTPAAAGSAGA